MAKSKNKGFNETRKPKKGKDEDNRPHKVRERTLAMNGGNPGSASNADARG